MKVQLASGVTVQMGKPYLNGSFYWIKRRVPKDLIEVLGGRKHLQYSLQTKDPSDALVRYAVESRRIDQILKEAKSAHKRNLPIASTISFLEERFGKVGEYLELYGSGELVHGSELLVEQLSDKAKALARKMAGAGVTAANGNKLSPEEVYDSIELASIGSASELAYLKTIQVREIDAQKTQLASLTLDDARRTYLSLHPKGDKRSVLALTNYSIDSFIDFLGINPTLENLRRSDLRSWIGEQLKSGLTPGTVDRRLTQFKAVLRTASSEFNRPELSTLVSKLSLPVPVKATNPKYVRRLPCQGYNPEVEVSGLQTLGLQIAGGNRPRDSWGRYSL